MKIIAALAAKPFYVLMARPEVRSGKELRGKALGIDTLASTTDYLSRLAVRFLGIPAQYQIIESGTAHFASCDEGGRDSRFHIRRDGSG